MFGKALRYGALHVDVNAHREILAQQTPAQSCVFLWLIVLPMCAATSQHCEPTIVCCSVLRALILPFFSLGTRKYYITRVVRLYFRGERTRAICALRFEDRSDKSLEAILKIYVHVKLMVFISSDELLRIRTRCVLLRYDLCTGYPKKSWFFTYTCIICISKRAKRTARLLIFSWQPNITFIF